jgi:uncharacterized membrane protein
MRKISPVLIARSLAVCFALYGLIAASFLAINLPPFQGPDEPAHFYRSEQISRGQLIGRRFGDGQSGGLIDSAVRAAVWPFVPVMHYSEQKVNRGMYASAAISWSGSYEWVDFSNSVVYPPIFYTPAAVGIWIGKLGHLTMPQTLYVARLCIALAAVTISFFAVWTAGTAAPWLFFVLLLPMSLHLMSAVTQDGLMIACSALAAALIAIARQRDQPVSLPALVAICASLAFVCMARPPYLTLAILPLALPGLSLRRGAAAIGSIVGLSLSWIALASWLALVKVRTDTDPSGQLYWMLDHPVAAVSVLAHSLVVEASSLLDMFIGYLGWLDTPLPNIYLTAAAWGLLIAAVISAGRPTDRGGSQGGWRNVMALLTVAAAVVGGVCLLFLTQYLTWTPVGGGLVEGLQGRYFIPLALLAAPIFTSVPVPARAIPLQRLAILAVAIFPIVSLSVVIRAITLRYYLP